ncbi:MAG: sigma-70 family RNA polymerase sigma factor [Pirellulales bacterium]|nr:sigma-70 family RNA polymerase sigma factor [Pirellulales bacterium]
MTALATGAQQLIEQCQGMVRSLALAIHRKLPPRYELDDLIAYGQVGLAEAAKDFDPDRGAQFSTFAYYRIRGAIYDGVSKMTWFGRAGRERARFDQRANEVLQAEAEDDSASSASNPENPPHVEDHARWFRDLSRTLAVVYLVSYGTASKENEELAFVDPASLPQQTIIDEEIAARLHRHIDALSAEESKLIRAMYFEGKTLEQAGLLLGIGKSWACRLHRKVLQRLARSLKSAAAEG